MITRRLIEVAALLAIGLFILLSVQLVRGRHHAEAIVFHGPSGQPAALVVSHRMIHIVMCTAPVWRSEAWSIDTRKASLNQVDNDRDEMVQAAAWQVGYRIVPPTPVASLNAMSGASTTTVAPNCLGFSIGRGTDALSIPGTWFAFASIPGWTALPLLMILPGSVAVHWRKQRLRAKRGQCLNCGFDLRASQDRCPECGQTITAH